MRTSIFIAIATFIATTSVEAKAEDVDNRTDTFIQGCKAAIALNDETADRPSELTAISPFSLGAGNCLGYINGFIGGYSFQPVSQRKFCLPPTVNMMQIARVLSRRFDERPEFSDAPKMAFVLGILMTTWPCHPSK